MVRVPKVTLTTSDGRTDTLVNWAAKLGIEKERIRKRLKAGWSVDEALKIVQRDPPPYVPPIIARTYTHDGETLTLKEWSKKTGVCEGTIKGRLLRGWCFNDAIKPPRSYPRVNSRSKPIEWNGERVTLAVLAKRFGMSRQALDSRLSSGWSLHDALHTPILQRIKRNVRS